MPRFRSVAILTAVIGFGLGVLLAAVDPGYDVALAADATSGGGVLRSLAQTLARPLVKALNLAGGTVVRPGANAVDPKQQQKPDQKQQQQKDNQQGAGAAGRPTK